MIIALSKKNKISLGTRDNPPTEIPLFFFGVNETSKGDYYLTQESAKKCIDAWLLHGIQLNADYEHASINPASNNGTPSSATFDLKIKKDGLYAVNINWSARSKEYFKMGEYMYYSPAFLVNEANEVVEIINFGLTNWPATRNQTPLVLSNLQTRKNKVLLSNLKGHSNMDLEKLKEKLMEMGMSAEEVDALFADCGMEAPAEDMYASALSELKDMVGALSREVSEIKETQNSRASALKKLTYTPTPKTPTSTPVSGGTRAERIAALSAKYKAEGMAPAEAAKKAMAEVK